MRLGVFFFVKFKKNISLEISHHFFVRRCRVNRFFFNLGLFTLYFNLLLFYIELSIGICITWIVKKENIKIESFPPLADLVLDNIYIYIYIFSLCTHTYVYMCVCNHIYIYIYLHGYWADLMHLILYRDAFLSFSVCANVCVCVCMCLRACMYLRKPCLMLV